MKRIVAISVLILLFFIALTGCGTIAGTNTVSAQNLKTASDGDDKVKPADTATDNTIDANISAGTASIADASMTSDVDDKGKPVDAVTDYSHGTKKFVVAAKLNNAPNNTKLNYVWYKNKTKIKEIPFDTQDKNYTNIYCNLKYDKPWPKGDYSVEIYVDGREKPDAVVHFKVK